MFLHEGDRVWVNVAPFIGAARRRDDQVPCQVLAVERGRLLVTTQPPYRVFTLWIDAAWVEGLVEADDLVPA